MNELYYAEMEAARISAEDAYFAARPHLNGEQTRFTFRAGFERAYSLLWSAQIVDDRGTKQ